LLLGSNDTNEFARVVFSRWGSKLPAGAWHTEHGRLRVSEGSLFKRTNAQFGFSDFPKSLGLSAF
jgi:hypothetical protein